MGDPLLTRHVKLRMDQRGISEDDIRCALRRRYGEPSAAASGKLWVYGYSSSGRILKVLLTAEQNVIVTAAWPDEWEGTG